MPLNGGIYYGMGAGLMINEKFQAELLYSVNNGSSELLGVDFDVEYSKLGVSVGFIF